MRLLFSSQLALARSLLSLLLSLLGKVVDLLSGSVDVVVPLLLGISTNVILLALGSIGVSVLLLLGLLLARAEPVGRSRQRVAGDLHLGADEGHDAAQQAWAAVVALDRLGVLVVPGRHDVVVGLACDDEGSESVVSGRLEDGLGVLLHDREVLVHFVETVGCDAVGGLDVRLGVVVWSAQVWSQWLAEAVVGVIGDLNGFGAVLVVLEVGDAIGDDWVGSQVLWVVSEGRTQ